MKNLFSLIVFIFAAQVSADRTFQIWAPGADAVTVKNDRQKWPESILNFDPESGIWSGTVSGVEAGDHYLFSLRGSGEQAFRLDPKAAQTFQRQWSVVVDQQNYIWQNDSFNEAPQDSAVIYELHVGSFSSPGNFASVEERLEYLQNLGVNYIELLPVHQSDRSLDWGYDVSLPNAIEEHYGTPDELKRLVDHAHSLGIGVILDVVHNHYSKANALQCYLGSCSDIFGSYFYQDSKTPWGPRPNFSEPQVRNLIEQNIESFVQDYKIDGFRWDAVPYITKFIEDESGSGSENPDGITLLQEINSNNQIAKIGEYFGAPSSATESVSSGGLGFDTVWQGLFSVVEAITQSDDSAIDMNNISQALKGDQRRVIFTENHDEVGHPPRQRRIPTRIDSENPSSLIARKRSLLGAVMLFTSPGIPMIFQGQEFLESQDFDFPTGTPLDWDNLTAFAGITQAYHDLIALRKKLFKGSDVHVISQNDDAKVLAFRRSSGERQLVVLINFSSTDFQSYTIGLPAAGEWRVLFSSDDQSYSPDFTNTPERRNFFANPSPYDGLGQSADLELRAYTAIILSN